MDDDTIICRCEDITWGEINKQLDKGYTTLDEIKRLTRAGMGPCQGKTCRRIL
ncbi:(2Fe-2S)-binding protein, partial [Klebsiella pneumoniae]|uniref:(2Fe-2S)-binding protein n=1 Tax=Klebsiella pneumoniae TaxID=573 RepID=UPI0034DDE9D5